MSSSSQGKGEIEAFVSDFTLHSLPDPDLMIAAIAPPGPFVLVTGNTEPSTQVKGLRVENRL